MPTIVPSPPSMAATCCGLSASVYPIRRKVQKPAVPSRCLRARSRSCASRSDALSSDAAVGRPESDAACCDDTAKLAILSATVLPSARRTAYRPLASTHAVAVPVVPLSSVVSRLASIRPMPANLAEEPCGIPESLV